LLRRKKGGGTDGESGLEKMEVEHVLVRGLAYVWRELLVESR